MQRAEHQPETLNVTIYGGVYYKVWSVQDAHTLTPQHSHEYDHLTAILRGLVRVWRDDEHIGDFLAPATVRIPAGCKHRFETLVGSCVFACIHNADRLDGDAPAVREEHHLVTED